MTQTLLICFSDETAGQIPAHFVSLQIRCSFHRLRSADTNTWQEGLDPAMRPLFQLEFAITACQHPLISMIPERCPSSFMSSPCAALRHLAGVDGTFPVR